MVADPGKLGVAPAVAAAVQQAGRWLADAGYAVEEIEPPEFMAAVDLWEVILGTEVRRSMLGVIEKFGDAAVRHSARIMDRRVPDLDVPAFSKALAQRSALLRHWMLFFETHPLVLMPTSCVPPVPVGADQGDAAGMAELLAAQRPLFPSAVLGLPGVSVPTGLSDGLPVGVQLVAGRFREDVCLDAAEIIEARAAMPMPIDPRPARTA